MSFANCEAALGGDTLQVYYEAATGNGIRAVELSSVRGNFAVRCCIQGSKTCCRNADGNLHWSRRNFKTNKKSGYCYKLLWVSGSLLQIPIKL